MYTLIQAVGDDDNQIYDFAEGRVLTGNVVRTPYSNLIGRWSVDFARKMMHPIYGKPGLALMALAAMDGKPYIFLAPFDLNKSPDVDFSAPGGNVIEVDLTVNPPEIDFDFAIVAVSSQPDSATLYLQARRYPEYIFPLVYNSGSLKFNFVLDPATNSAAYYQIINAPVGTDLGNISITSMQGMKSDGSLVMHVFYNDFQNVYRVNFDGTKYFDFLLDPSNQQVINLPPNYNVNSFSIVWNPSQAKFNFFLLCLLEANNDLLNYNVRRESTAVIPWMAELDSGKVITLVNLPGTHDSAAIDENLNPYACQRLSIKEQLETGVRLFDIRLSVQGKPSDFTFRTCHGDRGSLFGWNLFEPLNNVMDAFQGFLNNYPSEFLVAIVKIDDWNGYENDYRADVELKLQHFLNRYSGIIANLHQEKLPPTVGSCRGKIWVMNRMTVPGPGTLGMPIGWKPNAIAEYRRGAIFSTVAQDWSPSSWWATSVYDTKLAYFTALVDLAPRDPNEAHINFGSGIYFGNTGIELQPYVLEWLAAQPPATRKRTLGWCFFDYIDATFEVLTPAPEKRASILDMIIDSNFNYRRFNYEFSIRNPYKQDL